MEIYILEKLRSLDADRCNIVKWNDFFIDGDRICLNFELLDESLWRYMRYRGNRVLPVREIRPVLFQLANALSHLGSLGIVHADLKPGNIMVVDQPKILQQAKMEIFILEQLRGLDADRYRCNIVQWNGFFLDHQRICLNFELLDQCLWDYIEDRKNQGLPISEVRPILHQLTNALSHLGSLGIVHADLKPGNIMVVNRHKCPIKVKLIDFGFACPVSKVNPGGCEGTVGYRAPEVVIGSRYNEAIDMWSLGLVAVELATGVPFYPGKNDYDVLKFIIQTQGQPPDHVLDSALDPNQRITPSEVLHHPFFNPGLSKSSPCTDMKRTQKISCSSQNSEEFSQQEYVNASANTSSSKDDLEISKGTLLGDHYEVEGFLGEGRFGIVTKCRNTKTNEFVAIKVIKKEPKILQQAEKEILILMLLRGLDADRWNIVKWNDFFVEGHSICLNFELLDQSLWQYMRDRGNRVLPIGAIRAVLFQLANALSHLGSLGMVHADLKPRNIMVVDRYECPIKVKLIDFGFACPASTVIPGDCVGTVGYRAPEVMIGSLFNEAIDMWSLGLVAVELATGFPFYPGRNDYDVLKFIIQTQGQCSLCLRTVNTRVHTCVDQRACIQKVSPCNGLLEGVEGHSPVLQGMKQAWRRSRFQTSRGPRVREPKEYHRRGIRATFLGRAEDIPRLFFFCKFSLPPPQPVATDGCPFKSLVLSKVSSF
uniref:Protein kinase domain-containing protein n=1 Tax=Oreochromis aureus TaxID=47969 RepID=A0AAZ1XJR9_OREAU